MNIPPSSERDAYPHPTAAVSVVIPCYRCAKTIHRAIASVAAQTCLPQEVILVEDGSSDETLGMLRDVQQQYGERWIRIIALQVNVGPSIARNAGWDAAVGDFVAFLDADDAWHPEKIKLQYTFMVSHPEFTLTGHRHRQLECPPTKHPAITQDTFDTVSYRALLLSNRFITPSAMIKRATPCRFDADKRHMEDFHLWLTVAAGGGKIAILDAELAYIFKAPFGEIGLSADILAMEKGELDCYRKLHHAGHLGGGATLALSAYSCAKFLRRIALAVLLGRRAAIPWLFPLVYLTITQSTTALLIIVGVLGRPEIAADIALIQGATVATFYALSANARNMILRHTAPLLVSEILLARLVLLVPLMVVSVILAVTGSTVTWWLAVCLVVRRGVEWINEVHLCQAELSGRARFAVSFFLLQCSVFVFAAGSLAFSLPSALPALTLWAILPIAFSIRFLGSAARASLSSLKRIFSILTSHVGSTLIIGLRIYAFRILIVLLVAKDVAGDLFTAIAIGSFMGTLFANVFGPSIELHRERTGRLSFPRSFKFALTVSLAAGASLLLSLKFFPQWFPLLGKPSFFWLSCGLSLIGGALMVAAQSVRLRLLRANDGRAVFGPDVLIHISLLGAVPLAYFLFGVTGLSGLYLVDAILTYLFYKSSELALWRNEKRLTSMHFLPSILAFFLVFPLFFQLSGTIYNSIDPVVDSGGVLANLPLPISIIACFTGILLLARYRRATRSFFFILLFFAAMLLSSVVATDSTLERGKLLLLIQFMLPAFGLVLGEMIDDSDSHSLLVEKGLFWACALIILLQFTSSFAQGRFSLTHYVGLFSVYQHWQYVPVVVVVATLISVVALRTTLRYRHISAVLLLASLIYAAAAFSYLAIFLALVGIAGVAAYQTPGRKSMLAILSIAVVGLGGYAFLLRSTPEYSTKFVLPSTAKKLLSPPCLGEQARYVSNLVRGMDAECVINGTPDQPLNYLIALPVRTTTTMGALIVEGEILSGGITVGVVQSGRWALQKNFTQPGKFRAEIRPGTGRFEAILGNNLPASTINNVRIWRMAWEDTPTSESNLVSNALPITTLPPWTHEYLPTNLRERIEDWALFGRPILSNSNRFFFGNPPMDRTVRTSAHNYYIDLAYNFGTLALLPIIALFFYTVILIWRRKKYVMESKPLFCLAVSVAFFVLLDSNFKVTLRQPYPGLIAFFLWGLLLARLRAISRVVPVNPGMAVR